MNRKHVTRNPKETIELGKKLTAGLKSGDVICLSGDLGTGKTHFVKGMAEALEIPGDVVNSPTFTLINEYPQGNIPLYHFDFYRMRSEREARQLGTEEYFNGDGICVIEWAEKFPGLIPPNAIRITISRSSDLKRVFSILYP